MNLNQKFEELMAELEANIENKKDLEYIKNTFATLFLELLDEMKNVTEKNEEKIMYLEDKQKEIELKSAQLEEMVKKIEKDIYLDDNNYGFEIICPYCNHEFETDFDELKSEVKCPECNNIIELDWNEESVGHCSGNCSCCGGECDDEDCECDENSKNEEQDDDM